MNPPQPSVEQTYRRYFALIRAKCTRVLGDGHEAEDVAQETFIRFWQNRHDVATDPRSSAAWIYRTATRLSIDQLRRRRAAPAHDSLPSPSDPGNPEESLAARRAIAELLTELAPEELEVAVLCRIDGLGQREIAEVTRVSERTVRRLLQRVDERLARWAEANDLREASP
jgi:RNA polymerase sigma-70 factor (ECF subfamily)